MLTLLPSPISPVLHSLGDAWRSDLAPPVKAVPVYCSPYYPHLSRAATG